MTGAAFTAVTRLVDWLHAPVSPLRVLVLRRLVYAFVIIDVLWWHTSGEYHGWVDGRWYQPLVIGQLLPLPHARRRDRASREVGQRRGGRCSHCQDARRACSGGRSPRCGSSTR